MYNEDFARFWHTVFNAFGGSGTDLMLWILNAIVLFLANFYHRDYIHKRVRKPTDVGPFSRGQWYVYLIRVFTVPTVMYMSSGWAIAATLAFEIVGLGLLGIYIDWRYSKKEKK